MRSQWLVAALVVLSAGLPAAGQETKAPPASRESEVSSLPPLPEGDTGIAAKYPDDRGIETCPAVVFADDFEQGLGKWNASYGKPEITHEPADVHSGHSAVKMTLEWPRPERSPTNTGLMNYFDKGFDTLFLRYYAKYGKDLELYGGATHSGGCIFATTMATHNIKAGLRADGKNQFTLRLDCNRSDDKVASPGNLILYSYQPEQGSRFGDMLYPSGRFLPDRRRTTPRPFGEPFVSRPDIIPERDRWYCFEIMVQANTPGKHDGRMAFWVDGKLAADFPAVRVRDAEELKANLINISFYTSNRKVHGGVMWYDDVVAATSYIGPMVETHNSPQGQLRVATCQFPVSADIRANGEWIRRQIRQSHERDADLVHFSECALSGYAGEDFKSWADLDWDLLRKETDSILAVAKELGIWVVLGSTHQLSGDHKPHNCLYLINSQGQIVDRYDKRFCTESDLRYYSPGDHFVTFDINGVKCGLLICYDARFPELYRQYAKQGVQLMLHSFYNARQKPGGIHPKIMPPTVQAYAGVNFMFVSMNNSSAEHSWQSRFITPDGLMADELPLDQPGVMVNLVDTKKKFYDASGPFRIDCINGKLNSGQTVDDPRSKQRTGY